MKVTLTRHNSEGQQQYTYNHVTGFQYDAGNQDVVIQDAHGPVWVQVPQLHLITIQEEVPHIKT